MPGTSVGDLKPWPAWVHSDSALVDVARWLRDYHAAVASFVPPSNARWRGSGPSGGGGGDAIVCHNDAAPYNASWTQHGLVGFFDWDFAAPGPREWDLAFTASAWVPLHARRVARDEGFRAFDERRRRLDTFLSAYGWTGDVERLVLGTLRQRMLSHISDIERLAANGDPLFQALIAAGTVEAIHEALHELPDVLKTTP
jgi:thiamine kinase-like enzyme